MDHITTLMVEAGKMGMTFYAVCKCGWRSKDCHGSQLANKYQNEHLEKAKGICEKLDWD